MQKIIQPPAESNLVTIVIPTFNRADALHSTLSTLFAAETMIDTAKVVVLDNGSADETGDVVESFISRPEIHTTGALRLFKQGRNIGFYGNITFAAAVVSTQYTMFLSDEDDVIIANWQRFLQFLRSSSSAFISPICLSSDHKIISGEVVNCGITPKKLAGASNYISGLTYRTDYFRKAVDNINRLFSDLEFCRLYPQKIITFFIYACLGGAVQFCPIPVAQQRLTAISTTIKSRDGSPYWYLNSRWTQFKDQREIFTFFINNSTSEHSREAAEQLYIWLQQDLFRQLRAAVEAELGFGDILDRSAVSYLTRREEF